MVVGLAVEPPMSLAVVLAVEARVSLHGCGELAVWSWLCGAACDLASLIGSVSMTSWKRSNAQMLTAIMICC